ncbi:hypothetical protein SEVIR_4G221300v4 [Setaria viridis]
MSSTKARIFFPIPFRGSLGGRLSSSIHPQNNPPPAARARPWAHTMATLYPDWAGLPQEMVATVMRALDIPDLFRAGTVCSSWYAAYSDVRRVRIPITDAAPCLLYSARDNGDASDATLYSPSSGGKAFKVRLPDPPLGSRALVGSSHGWLAAADEASNLHLVNPLTGAQVALPPVMALYHVESSVDEQGSLEYSVQEGEDPDDPVRYPAQKLRLFLYYKVAMSCSPSKVRDRIVLLLHRPDGQISFAHIGDDKWTQITDPNSQMGQRLPRRSLQQERRIVLRAKLRWLYAYLGSERPFFSGRKGYCAGGGPLVFQFSQRQACVTIVKGETHTGLSGKASRPPWRALSKAAKEFK